MKMKKIMFVSGKERYMNCKKYRACLVGLIAATLICGMFLYVKNVKDNGVPAEGTLVKHEIRVEETVYAREDLADRQRRIMGEPEWEEEKSGGEWI